jgi:hypothetical protein
MLVDGVRAERVTRGVGQLPGTFLDDVAAVR